MHEAPRGNVIAVDPERIEQYLRVQKIEASIVGLPKPLQTAWRNIKTQLLDGAPPIQLIPSSETRQYGNQLRRFGSFSFAHKDYYDALNATVANWGGNNIQQGTYTVAANGLRNTEVSADILLDNGNVVAVITAEPLAHVVYIPDGNIAEVLGKTATIACALNEQLPRQPAILVFPAISPSVSAQPTAA